MATTSVGTSVAISVDTPIDTTTDILAGTAPHTCIYKLVAQSLNSSPGAHLNRESVPEYKVYVVPEVYRLIRPALPVPMEIASADPHLWNVRFVSHTKPHLPQPRSKMFSTSPLPIYYSGNGSKYR